MGLSKMYVSSATKNQGASGPTYMHSFFWRHSTVVCFWYMLLREWLKRMTIYLVPTLRNDCHYKRLKNSHFKVDAVESSSYNQGRKGVVVCFRV